MKRASAAAALVLLAGCGGKASSTPCTGTACPQVAGTYSVTATRTSADTCKQIVWGDEDMSGMSQHLFVIDQSASDLTLEGSDNIHGTLLVNNTTSFRLHSPHIDLGNCTSQCDFSEDIDVELTFLPSGAGTTFTGTQTVTLVANQAQVGIGMADQNCVLSHTLNGKLGAQ